MSNILVKISDVELVDDRSASAVSFGGGRC